MRFKDLPSEQKTDLETKRTRDALSWGVDDRRKAKDVSLGERCYLARRQAGESLKAAAARMGISHVTLIKRERNGGNVTALAKVWGLSGNT